MSKLNVYEGNSFIVTCAVYNPDGTDATLTGFTATLTIKTNKDDATAALISSSGVIVGNDITFTIAAASNTLTVGVYYYEITIASATELLTVTQDRLIVKESVYIT